MKHLLLLCLVQVIIVISSPTPDSWDWRTRGIIPPVKDEGELGSVVYFAVVDAIEAANAFATGKMPSLSIQQLIDCGPSPPDLDDTFKYVMQVKGLDTEASYPTNGTKGPCRFNPNTIGGTVSHVVNYTGGDEDIIAAMVYQTGPAVVYVDASSWEEYTTGIVTTPCGTIDHAVMIVGFGVQNDKKYWIAQNTWGSSWGINGYIYIARGSNSCCVATQAISPVA